MSKMPHLFFITLFLCFAAASAYALMPPHITETVPEDSGILAGDTVIFYGYTLSGMDLSEIKVTDLTAQESVPVKTHLSYEWEGKGNQPGAQQQFCTLKITLEKITPGHQYEVSVLETKITFTAMILPQTEE